MKKKTYTPPTVTEHGNAVKETKGFGGRYFEMLNPKPEPTPLQPPPGWEDDSD